MREFSEVSECIRLFRTLTFMAIVPMSVRPIVAMQVFQLNRASTAKRVSYQPLPKVFKSVPLSRS